MYAALAVYQLAKILVGRNEHRTLPICLLKHDIIRHAGCHFGNVEDGMSILSKRFDDLPIHTFIGRKIHVAEPTG